MIVITRPSACVQVEPPAAAGCGLGPDARPRDAGCPPPGRLQEPCPTRLSPKAVSPLLPGRRGAHPATRPRPNPSTAGRSPAPAPLSQPTRRRGGGASGGGQEGDACLGSGARGGEVCWGRGGLTRRRARAPQRPGGAARGRSRARERELAARREAGQRWAPCVEQCPCKSARGHRSLTGRTTRSGLLLL